MSAVSETEVFDATVDAPATGTPRTAASVRIGVTNLANRTKWMLARLAEIVGLAKTIISVDTGADTIECTAHGLTLDQPFRVFSVGGSPPGGLSAGTVYYARDISENALGAAAAVGGSAINLTSIGSGTLYLVPVVDAAAALYSSAGSLRSEIDGKGAKGGSNTWTGGNLFTASPRMEMDQAVVAPAGGNVDLVPAASVYQVGMSGGGTVTLQAPGAGWPAHPVIRMFAGSTGSAVMIRTHGGPLDRVEFGGTIAFAWADLRYTGSAWILIGWGGDAAPQ